MRISCLLLIIADYPEARMKINNLLQWWKDQGYPLIGITRILPMEYQYPNNNQTSS